MLSYPEFRKDFLNFKQFKEAANKPDEMIIMDAYFNYRNALDDVDTDADPILEWMDPEFIAKAKKRNRAKEFATGAFLFILAFLLDKIFKL